MQKKHVYSFNKGLVIGLEALGAFVLLAALLWMVLIIRLSRGPIDVDYLTNSIEKGLNSQPIGFNFDVGSTDLTWGGRRSIELEMRDVKVFREDNTPILAIEKIGVKLSKKYLLIGKIVPRVVKIYGPALRVVKNEDATFSLNVNDEKKEPQLFEETSKESTPQEELISGLLAQMKDDGNSFVSGLEQVSINDASMFYEDRKINIGWLSKKSNISFRKKDGGIAAEMIASVEMGDNKKGYIKGSAFYSWGTMKTNGIMYFTGLNPAKFARQSKKLRLLLDMNMDLKGSLAFECDDKFKLIYGRFVLGADKGTFNAMNIYNKPIAVSNFYTQGKFDSHAKGLEIEQFDLSLADNAKASMTARTEKNDAGDLIIIDAFLDNMPIDNLKTYWPDKLAVDARKWVVNNLSKGIAKHATLNTILLADKTEVKNIELIDVKGNIDFEGLDVDYFNPLKKVGKVDGTASYDKSSFNLDLKGGVLDDVVVTGSKIKIYDLDKADADTNARIDVAVALGGPLSTILKVIDSEPLKYPKKLGLVTENFSGEATLNLSLNFPLYEALKIEEVKVKVDSTVKNVLAKKVVSDFDLSSDSLVVYVDNNYISVDGKGSLGVMPITFKWRNNFNDKSEVLSSVEADITLGDKEIEKLGLPNNFAFKGRLPSKIEYTKAKDKSAKLRIKGNVMLSSFDIPYMNYHKESAVAGDIDLLLQLNKDSKLYKVSDIKYKSGADEIAGSLSINPDKGEISTAAFGKIKAGKNDISVNINKIENFYGVNIKGAQFDISNIISSRKKTVETEVEPVVEPSTPMVADIDVIKLITTETKYLVNAKMKMRTDEWERVKLMELDAKSGDKPLSMRYLPQTGGGYSFDFKADNAGEALEALDVTSSVKGGVLEVKGYPDLKSGQRDLMGTIKLSNFTLTNVSILGRLLNAMSLGGIVDLLNGKGIAFDKMSSQFSWTEKGKPDNEKTVRLIKIKSGETSGASLGLTFSGDVDMKKKFINIDGTIIPVSGISKVVGSIPVLGDILTGGDGGGIIAATYKIKGPSKDPEVTVNPLSVLAPGVIRKLFFE